MRLSQTESAQRGMNGVLAWTQSTGMPMRPAMSVMMTTETDPIDAEDAGIDAELRAAPEPRPGQPTRLTVRLTDAGTGQPIDDVSRSHEAWMHFIAIREDLGEFAHIHPTPTDTPGEFAVDAVFPAAGRYEIRAEFRRQGEMTDVLVEDELVVGDAGASGPARLVEDRAAKLAGGMRVSLDGEAEVGHESTLRFVFTDADTGAPVTDLQPYLAAAGHVVIMREDTGTFAHEHAEVRDADGRPVFALPGQRFGPEVEFHFHFDEPGAYKLWGQFRTADGDVVTVPFVVTAN
jgi:Cu+-exporting ATPase